MQKSRRREEEVQDGVSVSAQSCCGCGAVTVRDNKKRNIAVVSRYPRTGDGQQTERTPCVRSELQTDCVK
jgi:hypothetical protein